jgi:hypothetical protein
MHWPPTHRMPTPMIAAVARAAAGFVCNLITLARRSQLLHNYCLIKQNDLIFHVQCATARACKLSAQCVRVIYGHFSVAPNNNMQAHARIYLVSSRSCSLSVTLCSVCARAVLGRWLCIVCLCCRGSVLAKLWPRHIHTLWARSARHCCESYCGSNYWKLTLQKYLCPLTSWRGVHQTGWGC